VLHKFLFKACKTLDIPSMYTDFTFLGSIRKKMYRCVVAKYYCLPNYISFGITSSRISGLAYNGAN
jgi:hypothetical protein